jgi:hypothetical protein
MFVKSVFFPTTFNVQFLRVRSQLYNCSLLSSELQLKFRYNWKIRVTGDKTKSDRVGPVRGKVIGLYCNRSENKSQLPGRVGSGTKKTGYVRVGEDKIFPGRTLPSSSNTSDIYYMMGDKWAILHLPLEKNTK